MTDKEIWRDRLQGTTCICQAAKRRTFAFGQCCLGRLPEGMRAALEDGDAGYPDAYRRALAFLGFPEPEGESAKAAEAALLKPNQPHEQQSYAS